MNYLSGERGIPTSRSLGYTGTFFEVLVHYSTQHLGSQPA